jgi:carboxyl-terminal processing protease
VDVGEDDDGKVFYDGPLVLLTSRFSASATEIMVGALQDYGRGVVVGDSSTFGKGTVQSIVALAPVMDQAGLAHAYDPGALKVTISKFYRPSGASTQLRGVASDIVLPSTTDFADVSEATLKDPLPWDVVPSKTYEHLNRVEPYLAALRDLSARRVRSDAGFAYVKEDIDRLAKTLATKSISLNEAERRQEVAQQKARRAEHESVVRQSDAREPLSYEVTLENVDSPGLPAPTRSQTGAQRSPASRSSAAKGGVASADRATDAKAGADVILNESMKILDEYVDLLRPRADKDSLRRAAR